VHPSECTTIWAVSGKLVITLFVTSCEQTTQVPESVARLANSAQAAEAASAAAISAGNAPFGTQITAPETAFRPERPTALCSPEKTTTCNLDAIDDMPTTELTRVTRGEPSTLVGWAANGADRTVPPVVIMELAGDTDFYTPATRATPRPDVAAAQKVPAFLYSGYDVVASFRDVAPGTYSVKILQIGRSGKSLVCTPQRRIMVE
jgi:hypothetical protein